MKEWGWLIGLGIIAAAFMVPIGFGMVADYNGRAAVELKRLEVVQACYEAGNADCDRAGK